MQFRVVLFRLGVRGWEFGVRLTGLGCAVWGLRFGVPARGLGFGVRIRCLEFGFEGWVLGFGFRGLEFG